MLAMDAGIGSGQISWGASDISDPETTARPSEVPTDGPTCLSTISDAIDLEAQVSPGKKGRTKGKTPTKIDTAKSKPKPKPGKKKVRICFAKGVCKGVPPSIC